MFNPLQPRVLFDRLTRSTYVRQVVQTLATRAVTFCIGVLSGVLTARLLGPDGRGQLAVAGTVAGLGAQFSNLGLHAANTYFVARDRKRLAALFANSIVFGLLLGGAAALLFGAGIAIRPDLAPLSPALLITALLSIPVALVFLYVQSLLLGIGEIRTYNGISLTNQLLSFAGLAAVFVLAVRSPEVVYLTGVLASVVGVAWGVRAARRRVDGSVRFSRTLAGETLGYGVRAYLACLFSFLVVHIDVLMVQFFGGMDQAGYYATAVSLANIMYVPATVAGAIAFPRLASMVGRAERWRLTRRLGLTISLGMIPVCGVALLFAEPLVRLMYTAEFLPAAPAVRLLAVAMVFLGGANMFAQFLAANDYPWFIVGYWGVATVLNLALNFWLIPRHGIAGAAISSIVSYAFVFVVQYVYCVRLVRREDVA